MLYLVGSSRTVQSKLTVYLKWFELICKVSVLDTTISPPTKDKEKSSIEKDKNWLKRRRNWKSIKDKFKEKESRIWESCMKDKDCRDKESRRRESYNRKKNRLKRLDSKMKSWIENEKEWLSSMKDYKINEIKYCRRGKCFTIECKKLSNYSSSRNVIMNNWNESKLRLKLMHRIKKREVKSNKIKCLKHNKYESLSRKLKISKPNRHRKNFKKNKKSRNK